MTATLRERSEHAARYSANLVVPALEIKALLDQLDVMASAAKAALDANLAAETAITRVRELHTADADGVCPHCTRGRLYPVPAPCDSAAALAEGGDL